MDKSATKIQKMDIGIDHQNGSLEANVISFDVGEKLRGDDMAKEGNWQKDFFGQLKRGRIYAKRFCKIDCKGDSACKLMQAVIECD